MPMLNSPEPEVLTFTALLTVLGRRSRQSIYDLMRRDPSFPRPRQIGSESRSSPKFARTWQRPKNMPLSRRAQPRRE